MMRGSCCAAAAWRLFWVPGRHYSSMCAWQLHKYDPDYEHLEFSPSVAIPMIRSPTDVLINVKAASINPIDTRMAEGYGRTYLNVWRQLFQCRLSPISEFPLILGRDCSGTVVECGQNVTAFKPGDDVFCAVGPERQGCFSEYVVAGESSVAPKPPSLSHVECASVPYVACTVWTALCTFGRCNPENMQNKRVLIHGASGGIGTFAVQLARSWGSHVTGTCKSDAFDLVARLGAHSVVDYSHADAFAALTENAPYDVILDPVSSSLSRQTSQLLGLWRNCVYISLVSPFLTDGDTYGFPFGILPTAAKFATEMATDLASGGRLFFWAFFRPDGEALSAVSQMLQQKQIVPVVEKEVSFGELKCALAEVGSKHGRGKTVVVVNV